MRLELGTAHTEQTRQRLVDLGHQVTFGNRIDYSIWTWYPGHTNPDYRKLTALERELLAEPELYYKYNDQ